MQNIGIKVLHCDDIGIPAGCLSNQMIEDRWSNPLLKLKIFGFEEYHKLIYLDLDLLICDNLDFLFEKESFSAVSDSEFMTGYGRAGMNAGVITFTPSKQIEEDLIQLVPKVASHRRIFGDQDVINDYFPNWDNEEEKHLDVKFNTCFYEMKKKRKNPVVVHFILAQKPWMWTKKQILLKKLKYFMKGYFERIHYLNLYLNILKKVRKNGFNNRFDI